MLLHNRYALELSKMYKHDGSEAREWLKEVLMLPADIIGSHSTIIEVYTTAAEVCEILYSKKLQSWSHGVSFQRETSIKLFEWWGTVASNFGSRAGGIPQLYLDQKKYMGTCNFCHLKLSVHRSPTPCAPSLRKRKWQINWMVFLRNTFHTLAGNGQLE